MCVVNPYCITTYVNSRKLFILSRIAGRWGCKVPIYKVQSPYNNNDTRKGKAMFNLTKSEKAVFGKLVSQGNDLYVDGSGWHFNEMVFESFREFWKFCQDQLDK